METERQEKGVDILCKDNYTTLWETSPQKYLKFVSFHGWLRAIKIRIRVNKNMPSDITLNVKLVLQVRSWGFCLQSKKTCFNKRVLLRTPYSFWFLNYEMLRVQFQAYIYSLLPAASYVLWKNRTLAVSTAKARFRPSNRWLECFLCMYMK